jgi:hypothetical protein
MASLNSRPAEQPSATRYQSILTLFPIVPDVPDQQFLSGTGGGTLAFSH